MAKAFFKRLVLWLFLSLPVGIVLGVLGSLYLAEDGMVDGFTAAGNGLLTGIWMAIVGAIAAAGTTAYARDRLRAAGGSECITGAVVSYGLIVVAILLLWTLG